MVFYVYFLIDPITGKPFYIGKGQKLRMYQHVKDVQRGRIPNRTNTKLENKIKKILSSGKKVKYKKVFFTENEIEAYNEEKELIKEIGLKNLCNITEGGLGIMSGRKHSDETKRKISKNHARWNLGQNISEETKRKISENNAKFWLGKNLLEETKQKISKTLMGHTYSEETKRKISESLIGNIPWNKGTIYTNEDKRKIVESNRKRSKLNPEAIKVIRYFKGKRGYGKKII